MRHVRYRIAKRTAVSLGGFFCLTLLATREEGTLQKRRVAKQVVVEINQTRVTMKPKNAIFQEASKPWRSTSFTGGRSGSFDGATAVVSKSSAVLAGEAKKGLGHVPGRDVLCVMLFSFSV